MGRWLLALCLLMMAIAPAVAQDGAAQTLYTVQLDDTLENVIKQLKEEHGINLMADHVLLSTRVVVELEDATLLQLLEAICRQVGAVFESPGYYMPGQPAMWRLREGEWDLDSRPRTEVEGFLIAVESVSLQYAYSRRFSWGSDESTTSDSATLNIMMRVVPPSLELLGRIAGVAVVKAIFDTGETVEPPGQPQGMMMHRRMMARAGMNNISLPNPPENATRITELHGELDVYPRDPSGRAEFTPTEIGATRPFASANCTLETWEKGEGALTVTLKVTSVEESRQLMQVQQMAELLGPDGQRTTANSTSVNQRGDSSTYTFGFSNVTFEPVKLVLTGMVLGGPVDTHAFIIEDIELP